MSRSDYIHGLLLSLILICIFFFTFILNVNKPLSFSRLDTAHEAMTMKHYLDVIYTADFQNILNVPIFYGFKNTLFLSEPCFICGALGLPFYAFTKDINTIFNLVAVLIIYLSFFSMYVLVKQLTKQTWPAVLASIIFCFNTYVMSHFPDQMFYYILFWIPLIFLFVEKSLKKPTRLNCFLIFLLLTFQVLSTLTYISFLSVILPIYVLVRIWQVNFPIKKYINLGTLLGVILFLTCAGYLLFSYKTFYSKEPIQRGTIETSFYSAWPIDYLLSPASSVFYGESRSVVIRLFPGFALDAGELAEHSFFLGVIPIILFILSFFVLKRTHYEKPWLACLVLFVISVVLSFGPFIHITYDIHPPGPFTIVNWLNPTLSFVRAVSRFGIFAYFFLALICAFTLVQIQKKISPQMSTILILLLCAGLILEYYNRPLPFATIPSEVKTFYTYLNSRKEIKVIAELPTGTLGGLAFHTKDSTVDAKYMFYQNNFHSKKLINGYSSVIPMEYQRRQKYISINFPTSEKIRELKKWGVDGLVLHKDEFLNPLDFQIIQMRLNTLKVKEIYHTKNLYLYEIN